MDHEQVVASLHEWNRLTRENTENAIVSTMFEASSNAVAPVEEFATWLLAGAATVASFLLINADKLVPFVGGDGFLICGLLLCASCLFGFLSKVFALLGRITNATGAAINNSLPDLLNRHEQQETEIRQRAANLGVVIDTEIRMDRVLREFIAPLPWWARFSTARNLKKYAGNPQIGHIPRIKNLNAQGVCTFLQALAFLLFILIGFVAAA